MVRDAPRAMARACQRWRDLYGTVQAEMKSAQELAGDASATRADRKDAGRRFAEAQQQMELLLNSGGVGQSDYYSYRYLASEGFLPGYSFPRLPLSAYIPGLRGAGTTWLQRPRFLAIREFGPRSVIYHEGARYQVSRISLPRGQGDDPAKAGQVVLGEAQVCEGCGYHHAREVGLDVCVQCGATFGAPMKKLLQMQSVVTRRRERINADEEERSRVGFDLLTTYRFVPRGSDPGRRDATVLAADGEPLAEVRYGDAAEVRVTNIGPRRRRIQHQHGFWLDLVKGRWLTEKEAAGSDEDDDLEAAAEDVVRKDFVIPYVEDRRNLATLRWAEPVDDDERVTLRFALERGLEAVFQLEDSELTSEDLPDADGLGRTLFVEAAEGGAGVLRRVQAEPDALALVAAEALRIMHVDPATGEEVAGACLRGCYRCLLSYGNQTLHEQIDRRLAVPRLLALAGARAEPVAVEPTSAAAGDFPPLDGVEGRLADLLGLLQSEGLRPPTAIDTEVDGTRVDLVYAAPTPSVVLLLDTDSPDSRAATLAFSGWNVVQVRPGDDLAAIVAANPSVFGEPA